METIQPTIDTIRFVEAPPRLTNYQVFTHQLENSDPRKPCEDASPLFYEIEPGLYFGGIFDGITRSPKDGSYPTPSPARMAADFLLQRTPTLFNRELNGNSHYSKALKNTLIALNNDLQIFNSGRGFTEETVDYDENDMPGASVLLSVIEPGVLHIGMIADCTAYVFGNNGGRLVTPVQTNVKDAYKGHLIKTDPNFNNEEWRKYYRRFFRNHKDVEVEMNGQTVRPDYGALTGERGAPDFIEAMDIPLDPDDIVILASDGSLSVSIEEMNDILRRRLSQQKPEIILPEIFGRAQVLANENGKHSDDRTGILYIPQ